MVLIVPTAVEMLSVLTGWMSTWLSMFLVCVIQTYSIVCHYFMGLLNAFGFTNWIMSGCIVFYASVVLPSINTQSNVITLLGLLVRSLNILPSPLPTRQGLVIKYKNKLISLVLVLKTKSSLDFFFLQYYLVHKKTDLT